jgi:ubiquinone/menaquinone biosynthesis C-methylase UbiE
MNPKTPPVCSYEGSDYQSSFWDRGGRAYEDAAEAIALRKLLPDSGRLILELGAGAGRNTLRYAGFSQVVLLDYSRTQLQQAQERLGRSQRYIYVAADIYRLPFAAGAFDAATMIRTLHHMADAPMALWQVREALAPEAAFVLEYANKCNLKAILRYLLKRQAWSPFSLEPVEFAELNFDFHPKAIRNWLATCEFRVERQLTVSHFRQNLLKRTLPAELLARLDDMVQFTGEWWQLTPSVFVLARAAGDAKPGWVRPAGIDIFKCPACGCAPLEAGAGALHCPQCGKNWPLVDGIYDFR